MGLLHVRHYRALSHHYFHYLSFIPNEAKIIVWLELLPGLRALQRSWATQPLPPTGQLQAARKGLCLTDAGVKLQVQPAWHPRL